MTYWIFSSTPYYVHVNVYQRASCQDKNTARSFRNRPKAGNRFTDGAPPGVRPTGSKSSTSTSPMPMSPIPGPDEQERPLPSTQFFRDGSKTIITRNNSPDVGFETSLNPYRGCEHGCIYCYARPTHEYLGLSAGLDFESKIVVKLDAPELLRAELESPRWRPQVLVMSGVTDPVPTCRKTLADYARLPGNPSEISEPGRDHHQEPARYPRHRSVAGIGELPRGRREYFGHFAGPGIAARARTAHFVSPGASGRHQPASSEQESRSG